MHQIDILEKEIDDLRRLLQEKEGELFRLKNEWTTNQLTQTSQIEPPHINGDNIKAHVSNKLPRWAIERYSRQILLPEIGVEGQERLCAAKVLVVGAGGLGCPAAVYLAGAGVGEIAIVDYDTVDLTNIHRQILHMERDQNTSKAESAADKLRSVNSNIKVVPYNLQLSSSNSLQLVSQYDIVLDCTDNVPTRYLLSDTCVLAKVPLISGSALKLEGQLTIYVYRNKRDNGESAYIGPCYRCVFPSPPPAEAVGSCSANGVAGPLPGVIGALQALEAIKLIVGQSRERLLVERMLLFDGEDMTFRTVKLRPRVPACPSCSESPSITQLIDYEEFCHTQAKEKKRRDSHLKSELRKREKQNRMSGKSYYGFRSINKNGYTKWVQDVPKSERKLGKSCKSEICLRNKSRKCGVFSEDKREEIFGRFWNVLDWKGKRDFVRSLVDFVPVKRRRLKHKGEISRKVDSKLYHLMCDGDKVQVCRIMFLNTLGIKEAMVRCWLTDSEKQKTPKKPTKTLNVDTYIDNLPKTTTRCRYCLHSGEKHQYFNIANVKNLFQLYTMYVRDMKLENISPASRKTFSKVICAKNVKIFKPKTDSDICDVNPEHNVTEINCCNEDVYYYM